MAFKLIIFLFVFLNSLAYSQEPQNLISAKEAIEIIKEEGTRFDLSFVEPTQNQFLKTCGDQLFDKDIDLMHQYCKAFVSSDICKKVSPERRMNCNKDIIPSITDSPSLIWNCLKGVGLGAADIIVMLAAILEGIFTFITSPIESSKHIVQAGKDLNQLQNYVNTGYMSELQNINKENPPPDSNNNQMTAAKAVSEKIFANLTKNVENFLAEKHREFYCLNNDNMMKMTCQHITNFLSLFVGGVVAVRGLYSSAKWFMNVKKGAKLTPPKNLAKGPLPSNAGKGKTPFKSSKRGGAAPKNKILNKGEGPTPKTRVQTKKEMQPPLGPRQNQGPTPKGRVKPNPPPKK